MKIRQIWIRAACGMLFLGATCQAGVIWSGPRNLVVPDFFPLNLELDIDDSGSADLQLSYRVLFSTDVPPSQAGVIVTGHPLGNDVWASETGALPMSTYFVHPETVIPAGAWRPGTFGIGVYGVDLINHATTGWQGTWAGTEIGFMSLLFKGADDRYRLAWIRLTLPEVPPPQLPTVTVVEWYYDSEPIPDPTVTFAPAGPTGSPAIEATLINLQKGWSYSFDECTSLNGEDWMPQLDFSASGGINVLSYELTGQGGFFRLVKEASP